MTMFTIKEEDTGNYVSEMSFGKHDAGGKTWTYSTFTGRCSAMRYFPSIEATYEMITKLTEKARELGLNKKYIPIIVHKNHLPWVSPIRNIV